ncbi:hypothetical protein N9D66_01910 [Candidatus Nanopelagicales bacterium]|nr:hypothetical protein [Candidatus Nanopelagicales bacterium]
MSNTEEAVQDVQEAGNNLTAALNRLTDGATDIANTQVEAVKAAQDVLTEAVTKLQAIAKTAADKTKAQF